MRARPAAGCSRWLRERFDAPGPHRNVRWATDDVALASREARFFRCFQGRVRPDPAEGSAQALTQVPDEVWEDVSRLWKCLLEMAGKSSATQVGAIGSGRAITVYNEL